MEDTTFDVIIVGAGVAGSAIAYALGKNGRNVLVIERDLTKPDRIVGEVLQPGGYHKLIELGLEDCVEEIDAQNIYGYIFYKGGKNTRCSYLSENMVGKCFHNGKFVQRMRQKAATLPNVTIEQGTATSLIQEKGTIMGVLYKTNSGQELRAFAPLSIVSDGRSSNLRRFLCKPKVDISSQAVGVVLKNCHLPYADHGHIIIANPSIILFYPISSNEVRCMVKIPGKKLPSVANGEMVKYMKNELAPHVPQELRDAFVAAINKNGNIRTVPNRSMPADLHSTAGALLLGGALNMRHSITGGGMTVALSDAVILRDLLGPLGNLQDSQSICRHLESFYTLRMPMSFTVNTMANAVYKAFSASPNDQGGKELGEACFGYLSLGGSRSNGCMALISGLNPNPLALVLHSVAMVMFGVGRLLFPFPSPRRIWLGARLIMSALSITVPIMKAEGVMRMFSRTVRTSILLWSCFFFLFFMVLYVAVSVGRP